MSKFTNYIIENKDYINTQNIDANRMIDISTYIDNYLGVYNELVNLDAIVDDYGYDCVSYVFCKAMSYIRGCIETYWLGYLNPRYDAIDEEDYYNGSDIMNEYDLRALDNMWELLEMCHKIWFGKEM